MLQEANQLFDEGNFQEALDAYERLLKKAHGRGRPNL